MCANWEGLETLNLHATHQCESHARAQQLEDAVLELCGHCTCLLSSSSSPMAHIQENG